MLKQHLAHCQRMRAIACVLVSISLSTNAALSADRSAAELVRALQGGGLVVYIRHAETESDYADQVTADPNNCATQRTLSEAGWRQAKAIGQGMAAAHIPVGPVLSSQYCRAWQTADLAFGRYEKTDALNFEPAEDYSPAQFTTMRERVRPLLTAPGDGTNLIIVGHDDPFEAVTGIYPEPMGVAYVLRPQPDGGVDVLGYIQPGFWAQ